MGIILEVIGLNKSFKVNFSNFKVLKDVNLEVFQGEIYGFLGPNGSGKTTSLKCILGFLKISAGEILIFDKYLKNHPDLYKRIGYAPESTYFYDHLNGLEFLKFMGELAGMTKQEAELSGLELLDRLGLEWAKDRYVKSYSKGMKQRLGLASSLINDPDILFWDEPMSGLDPMGRFRVKDLMKELKKAGKTIFFNTHILSDVQEVADRFGVIYDGEIIAQEKTSKIKKPLEEYFMDLVKEFEDKKNEEE